MIHTMQTRIAFISIFTMVVSLTCRAGAVSWNQQHKLMADDAAESDMFGSSVAVSGGTAIVGAVWEDHAVAGTDSGAAYLFDVITGAQLAKLTASDGAAGDLFGGSVDIAGSTAIVGARKNESAYLFDVDTGTQFGKLTANDATSGAIFGASVAISGNVALVGAYSAAHDGERPGAAYLFDVTTGRQLAKLTALDAEEGDRFGWSVGISGNTAIVGAYLNDHAGKDSGAAYLFDVTSGRQLAKLIAEDAAEGELFGYSVDIDGNTAIITASTDANAATDIGSAYLFDVATGSQLAKLVADDARTGRWFQSEAAISGDIAIVGEHGDTDGGDYSGAAYLFDVESGTQLAKLKADDVIERHLFGNAVDIDGNTVVVGTAWDNHAGHRSGSAYVFVPEPSCLVLLAAGVVTVLLARRRLRR